VGTAQKPSFKDPPENRTVPPAKSPVTSFGRPDSGAASSASEW
jgi:hypothetical protein